MRPNADRRTVGITDWLGTDEPQVYGAEPHHPTDYRAIVRAQHEPRCLGGRRLLRAEQADGGGFRRLRGPLGSSWAGERSCDPPP